MAFVAENGTGLATATALCSVEFADAYFEDRRVTAWAGADEVKEAALIKATDYVEGRWGRLARNGGRFLGSLQFPDVQALSFPRLGISSDDAVPVGIQKAVAEYALRALSAPLQPDPVPDSGGRVLAEKTTKVGPIETSLKYEQGAGLQTVQPYPAADAMVRAFLAGGAGVYRG